MYNLAHSCNDTSSIGTSTVSQSSGMSSILFELPVNLGKVAHEPLGASCLKKPHEGCKLQIAG